MHRPLGRAIGHLVDTFTIYTLAGATITVTPALRGVLAAGRWLANIIGARIPIVARNGVTNALPGHTPFIVGAFVGVVTGTFLLAIDALTVVTKVGSAFQPIITMVILGAGHTIPVHTNHVSVARFAAVATAAIVAADLAVAVGLTETLPVSTHFFCTWTGTTLTTTAVVATVLASTLWHTVTSALVASKASRTITTIIFGDFRYLSGPETAVEPQFLAALLTGNTLATGPFAISLAPTIGQTFTTIPAAAVIAACLAITARHADASVSLLVANLAAIFATGAVSPPDGTSAILENTAVLVSADQSTLQSPVNVLLTNKLFHIYSIGRRPRVPRAGHRRQRQSNYDYIAPHSSPPGIFPITHRGQWP